MLEQSHSQDVIESFYNDRMDMSYRIDQRMTHDNR